MKSRIFRITILSVFVAISLAFFSLELLIPPFTFLPGAKIGLANVVTLFMLTNGDFFRPGDCFLVLISRCILSALLSGRLLSVCFSLFGGISAMVAMMVSRKVFGEKSVVLISIIGAVFHNLTQILIAVLIYGTFSALYYIPSLLIVGILSGTVIGLCVLMINKMKILRSIL